MSFLFLTINNPYLPSRPLYAHNFHNIHCKRYETQLVPFVRIQSGCFVYVTFIECAVSSPSRRTNCAIRYACSCSALVLDQDRGYHAHIFRHASAWPRGGRGSPMRSDDVHRPVWWLCG